MVVGFIISLPLWFWFDRGTSDQMQFVESVQWIKTLGANYHVGIDGISLLLVMLTTLLGPLAVLSSWEAIDNRVKEYYVFMLMLQAGMLGVFISLDFFLFYVFWEVMLVPMYFLIGVWGGPRKLYAAIKFFLYTLFGSVLLLLGILALYFTYPGVAAQHPEIAAQFGTGPTFDVLAFHAIAPYLAVQLPVLDFPRVLRRICHQGSDVPVPYVAAGRARRSADGGFGHSGRRAVEDGNVRISAIQSADSAGRHEILRSDDDRACRSSASSTARWSR